MGFRFYDTKSRPKPFDIVWSKWPHRDAKLAPGPAARPVLVIDSVIMEDVDGQQFAAVTAQYGGNFEDRHVPQNLLIGKAEFQALGLHKPTLFRLDAGNRMRLPWCEEYFVPQGYVQSQKIICGALNSEQKTRMLECFKARRLQFPPP